VQPVEGHARAFAVHDCEESTREYDVERHAPRPAKHGGGRCVHERRPQTQRQPTTRTARHHPASALRRDARLHGARRRIEEQHLLGAFGRGDQEPRSTATVAAAMAALTHIGA
jgi:hypothetical protein